MRKLGILLLAFVLGGVVVLSAASPVFSAAPKIFSYQGRLANMDGDLLGSTGTTYYFRFAIFDAATAGTQLWPTGTPATIGLTVQNGVFNVLVGDTSLGFSALTLNFEDNTSMFLAVQVAARSDFSDGETLTPRQRIGSSGYAINADTVRGLAPGTGANNILQLDSSGNIAIAGMATISSLQSTANASSFTVNAPVSGTDTGAHTLSLQVDGNTGLSIAATGDGSGGVGARTIQMGVSSAADTITIGDSNTNVSITDADWSITGAGAASFASLNSTPIGATTVSSGAFTTLSSTGATTIGNDSATVAIDSSDWNISTTGAMTGIGAISMDGSLTISGVSTITDSDSAVTIDDDLTITTGTTISATSITALNCTDCIDGDDLADAIALDTSTSIAQDSAETFTLSNGSSGNTIVNLTSSGDFVLQDGGTTVLTFTDAGVLTLAAQAPSEGQNIFAFTNTAGSGTAYDIIDIAITAATDDAGAADQQSGISITMSSPVVSDTQNGILIMGATAAAGIEVALNIPTITGGSGGETAISIGGGWDTNLDFGDTTTVIKLDDGGSITFEDDTAADGTDIFILRDVSTASSHELMGDSDTGLILSGMTTDLTTTGNEALTLTAAGTGDVAFSTDADTQVQVTASAAPGVDMIALTNSGQVSTTSGVDAVSLTFGTSNASGDAINIIPSFAGGATDALDYNAIEIAAFSPTNSAGADEVRGMLIGTLTDPGATITSMAIEIAGGWDANIFFNDTTTQLQITDGGTFTFEDASGNGILTLADISTSSNHTFSIDSNTALVFDSAADTDTDITTATNEDLEIVPNGSGDVEFQMGAGAQINVATTAAPTADIVTITSMDTEASATSGVDALKITFGTSNASGNVIDITPVFAGGATDGLQYIVIDIDTFSPANASGTDGVVGLQVGNLTDPGATITSTAITIGSGWDDGININSGEAIIEVSGVISLDLQNTETTNGLCHSGADVDAATDTTVDVVSCSAAPGDYAEWYETEMDVGHGEVVALTDRTITYEATGTDPFTGMMRKEKIQKTVAVLGRASEPYGARTFGVVSTSPIQTIGADLKRQGAHPMPIALTGRVPVKISDENGPIAVGDYLTASAMAGHAMKATAAGRVIGIALEPWNSGAGMIMMLVSNFSWDGKIAGAAMQGGEIQPLLQLQDGTVTRFLVQNDGQTTINTAVSDPNVPIFAVRNNDADRFVITASGDVVLAGTLVFEDTSFAGWARSDSSGMGVVNFSRAMQARPVVQLTPEGDGPIFAVVSRLLTDAQENYIGFEFKTYGISGSVVSAKVHYLVVGSRNQGEVGSAIQGSVPMVSAPADPVSEPVVEEPVGSSDPTAPSSDGAASAPPIVEEPAPASVSEEPATEEAVSESTPAPPAEPVIEEPAPTPAEPAPSEEPGAPLPSAEPEPALAEEPAPANP